MDLIQKDLVAPFLENNGDAFSIMFMKVAGANLCNLLAQHAEVIATNSRRRDGMKVEINLRFRAACSGGGALFVYALAERLGVLNEYWLAFHADPFEWRNGIKIVRGTQQPWPDNIHHQSRLEAIVDNLSIFDSLRTGFLIPDDTMAKVVVDAIYELADERVDGDLFRQVADGILGYLDDNNDDKKEWGAEVKEAVLEAYLKMTETRSYYFNIAELVWMCAAANANIIVAQRYGHAYMVEHYYLDGAGEVAIVAIDSDAEGRVAAHFERLICLDEVETHRIAEQEVEQARAAEEENRIEKNGAKGRTGERARNAGPA